MKLEKTMEFVLGAIAGATGRLAVGIGGYEFNASGSSYDVMGAVGFIFTGLGISLGRFVYPMFKEPPYADSTRAGRVTANTAGIAAGCVVADYFLKKIGR